MSTANEQPVLAFVPTEIRAAPLEVLDLFTGLGGLALGFRGAGFAVTGVDKEETAAEVYGLNSIGTFLRADLATTSINLRVGAIVGGPPCRPWSNVNLQRRRSAHHEHVLLDRFFEHVIGLRPDVFVMENVLALKSDDVYRARVLDLRSLGYAVENRILRYSDFGAATSRRRLFTVGVRNSAVGPAAFWAELDTQHQPAETVRTAISWTRNMQRHAHPDHDWSELESISNYGDRYRSGQYGWKQLVYDEPAPSFGSIAKTYILHPEAGQNDFELRVLSVREAMSIMGFARDFRFPEDTARARRYQMVANAVSPIVARACANAVAHLLNAGAGSSKTASPLVRAV